MAHNSGLNLQQAQHQSLQHLQQMTHQLPQSQSHVMSGQVAQTRTLMFIVELADVHGSLIRRVSPMVRQIEWPVGMPVDRINELIRQHVVQALPEAAVQAHALVLLDQTENPVTLDELLNLGELYKVRAIPQSGSAQQPQLTMSYSPTTIGQTSLFAGTLHQGDAFNHYRGTRNNWQQIAQAASLGQNGSSGTYNQRISSIRRPQQNAYQEQEEMKQHSDDQQQLTDRVLPTNNLQQPLLTPQPPQPRTRMAHLTPAQLERVLDQQSDSAAMARSIKSMSSASGRPIAMAPSFGLQLPQRSGQQLVQPAQQLQQNLIQRQQNDQRLPDAMAVQAQMARMQVAKDVGNEMNESQAEGCNVTQSVVEQNPVFATGASGLSNGTVRSNLSNLQMQPFGFKKRPTAQQNRNQDDFNVNISSEDETQQNGLNYPNGQLLRQMSSERDAIGFTRGQLMGLTAGTLTERHQAIYDPMTGQLISARAPPGTVSMFAGNYGGQMIDNMRPQAQQLNQMYGKQVYHTVGAQMMTTEQMYQENSRMIAADQQFIQQMNTQEQWIQAGQNNFGELYARIRQSNASINQRQGEAVGPDQHVLKQENDLLERSLRVDANRSLAGLSNIHKTESQEFEALLSSRKATKEKVSEPHNLRQDQRTEKDSPKHKTEEAHPTGMVPVAPRQMERLAASPSRGRDSGERSTSNQRVKRVDSIKVQAQLLDHVVSDGFAGFGQHTAAERRQSKDAKKTLQQSRKSQFSSDRDPLPEVQDKLSSPKQNNEVFKTPVGATKRQLKEQKATAKKKETSDSHSSPIEARKRETISSQTLSSQPAKQAAANRVENKDKAKQGNENGQIVGGQSSRQKGGNSIGAGPLTPNIKKQNTKEDEIRKAKRRRVKALSSSEAPDEKYDVASLEDQPAVENVSGDGTNSLSLKNQIKNLVGDEGHEEPLAPYQNPLTPVTRPRVRQMVKNIFSFNAPQFGQIATTAAAANTNVADVPKTPEQQKSQRGRKRLQAFKMKQRDTAAFAVSKQAAGEVNDDEECRRANEGVHRLHSQSFEDNKFQPVSPVPTPKELKAIHKVNRQHEDFDNDQSQGSGAAAPERLIEKTNSEISYVPPTQFKVQALQKNTFDDQKTELGAISNNDALTSYSAYNNQPCAPMRAAEQSESDLTSDIQTVLDRRQQPFKSNRRFSVAYQRNKNAFDDQKTVIAPDYDNLTSYSQYNAQPCAPDRQQELSVSCAQSRGPYFAPVTRNAFDDQVTVQLQPELSDSASNNGPSAPQRAQEFSRSDVSAVSRPRREPTRKHSANNAPLSAIGFQMNSSPFGNGNEAIDFDAKTVLNNPRDDASSISALPAPARVQETSFDTNSQINLFYKQNDQQRRQTAQFVSLRASQEIENIPGAKSPFLRLSNERQKQIIAAAQSIGLGNTPFLSLRNKVTNSVFPRFYSVQQAQDMTQEEPKTLADFGNLVEAEKHLQDEEEQTLIISPNQALNIGKPLLYPVELKAPQQKESSKTIPRMNTLGSGSQIKAIGSFQLNKDSVIISQNSIKDEEAGNENKSAAMMKSVESEMKNFTLIQNPAMVVNSSTHEKEANNKNGHQAFQLVHQIKSADQVAEVRRNSSQLEQVNEDKVEQDTAQNEVNPFNFQMKTEAKLCFQNVFPQQNQDEETPKEHETSGRFGDKTNQQ